MKYIKDFKSINEDILHHENNLPNIGAKVISCFAIKPTEISKGADRANIIIEGCDAITLVGDFSKTNLPIVTYNMDTLKYEYNGIEYTWEQLKSGELK